MTPPVSLIQTISLKYCEIESAGEEVFVRFPDGTYCSAVPHDTHHYHVIAHRCGYQDDIYAYCLEHEVCHALLAEVLHDGASHILWALAHDEIINSGLAVQEEATVHLFQRWLRANERPILSGPEWDVLKAQALALLD